MDRIEAKIMEMDNLQEIMRLMQESMSFKMVSYLLLTSWRAILVYFWNTSQATQIGALRRIASEMKWRGQRDAKYSETSKTSIFYFLPRVRLY